MLRSRRFAFAAAALLVGLSACGDTNPSTIVAKSPTVIHVGANTGKTAPTAAGTVDSSMRPYYGNITYVFDGQFPDLGATGGAWSIPAGQKADPARVSALAGALGVKGEVRSLPADQGGGWAVGPTDGSGPSITVAGDGLLTWWYSGTSGPSSVACATGGSTGSAGSGGAPIGTVVATGVNGAVSPPDQPVPMPDPAPADSTPTPPTIVLPPECQPTPPPANLPDKAAALAKAKDLLVSMGGNAADYEFTTYADQYSASVSGFLRLGGHRTQLQFNVGFGAEGVITYASGFLASPQVATDYPLVSGDVAVQRLNDPTGKWMFFGGPRPMTGGGIAIDTVANSATSIATSTGGGSASTPSAGAPEPAVAPMPPATIVCDAGSKCAVNPGDTIPAPAPITIHLNGARLDLIQIWAQDGTVWLLPAYTFTTTDGGEYTVVAVEESFLDLPKPDTGTTTPSETKPIPPAPDTAVPGT